MRTKGNCNQQCVNKYIGEFIALLNKNCIKFLDSIAVNSALGYEYYAQEASTQRVVFSLGTLQFYYVNFFIQCRCLFLVL